MSVMRSCTSVVFGSIIFLILPFTTHASVLINEIAWMGTTNSANDEWIELYNNGSSPVTLDGWELTDGASLSILLSGTLGAGSYGVLERTDDNSAPGSAFLIYTGALSNDGRTLTLTDANDNIHDQVAGGENWENIGGDNATKETAQLTTSGWVTAAATAGSKNVSASSASSQTTTETNNASSDTAQNTSASSGGSSRTNDVNLSISVPRTMTGYVNQSVPFSVRVSGVPESRTKALRYVWNFGDSTTDRDNNPEHRYRFPGKYVVMVEVSYSRYIARERIEVTILPFTTSLEIVDGNVLLHNNAAYEVDISGMKISNGSSIYTFPPHTILLPNATLTLSKHVTGFGNVQFATIFDGRGNTVAQVPNYHKLANADAADTVSASNLQVSQKISEKPNTSTAEAQTAPSAQSASAVTAAEENSDDFDSDQVLIYSGFIGMIMIGVLAVYANHLV